LPPCHGGPRAIAASLYEPRAQWDRCHQ
jgi:hypothetical protein